MKELRDLRIGERAIGPRELVGEVFQLWHVLHRKGDDLHEYPGRELFGKVFGEITTACRTKALDQRRREFPNGGFDRTYRLGRQTAVEQVAKRCVRRRVKRQRDQSIGFPGGILGYQDRMVGKIRVVRKHLANQFSSQDQPVTPVARRPYHIHNAGILQRLPGMMEVFAFPKRLIDIEINQTLGRYMGRSINNCRILHICRPHLKRTVSLPAQGSCTHWSNLGATFTVISSNSSLSRIWQAKRELD